MTPRYIENWGVATPCYIGHWEVTILDFKWVEFCDSPVYTAGHQGVSTLWCIGPRGVANLQYMDTRESWGVALKFKLQSLRCLDYPKSRRIFAK